MKGDEEKERAFINSVHRFKRVGRKRLMGGDQAKMEVDDTKEQETVAKNIIASDAGGDDVERFMRTTAKGSATEILFAGEPTFCRRELPSGRRFLLGKTRLQFNFQIAMCSQPRLHGGVVGHLPTFRLCIDCASRIKCA